MLQIDAMFFYDSRYLIGESLRQKHHPRRWDTVSAPLRDALRAKLANARHCSCSAECINDQGGVDMLHSAHCNHSYHASANYSYRAMCNPSYMDTLSKRIADLRQARGLSQAQVADAVGVSRVSVTKWESGQTANLKLPNLVALCRLFETTADDLITFDNSKRINAYSNTFNDNSNAVCEKDHEPYRAIAIASPLRIFTPEQEQAYNSLTEEGRALVRAQVDISIKTAVQIHGTRPKQTAA